MASLLENLVEVLERENAEYEILVDLANRKTPCIVHGDVESLDKITEEEQVVVGRIQRMEKQRKEILADVANVVNRDVETLKLKNLIQMLDKRPDQKQMLEEVQVRLLDTVSKMRQANEKNQMLLEDAQEMVGFNLNMIRALKSAPQTANYSKNAYCTGSALGCFHGGFDAKQ